jgi:hypothetical protein
MTRPVVCAASHQLFSLFNFSRGAVPLLFSVFLPVSAPLDFACCGFGLILGYKTNSLRNFDWLPFTPPYGRLFGPSIGIRAGLVTSWL